MASGKRDISSFNRTAELNVSWLIAVLTCAIIFFFRFYVRISEIAYSNIYYPIYIITVIIAFQRISELWKTYWLEWYAQTRSTEMLVITYLPTGRRRWAEKRSCKCNLRIYSVRAFSKQILWKNIDLTNISHNLDTAWKTMKTYRRRLSIPSNGVSALIGSTGRTSSTVILTIRCASIRPKRWWSCWTCMRKSSERERSVSR